MAVQKIFDWETAQNRLWLPTHSVWKSQKKVAFKIASEAKFTFLSGQKFIKNAKNYPIVAIFRKSETCGQTVLPDRSILSRQKLVKTAKIEK